MYCATCGQKETPVKTKRFDRDTGEPVYVDYCLNPNCVVGRQNVCGINTGHTIGFFIGTCKNCGFQPCDWY